MERPEGQTGIRHRDWRQHGSPIGALAFLGRAYDPQLKAVYTETSASDIFEKRAPLLGAIAGDALTDNAPLRQMISRILQFWGGLVEIAATQGLTTSALIEVVAADRALIICHPSSAYLS